MKKDLLLVGSIPCNTVEEVFRTWGVTFAAHLEYMPDGEVGDRLHWIDGQAYRTFNGHPNIETLKRPHPTTASSGGSHATSRTNGSSRSNPA